MRIADNGEVKGKNQIVAERVYAIEVDSKGFVKVPNYVTEIGAYAFALDDDVKTRLKSVEIPDTVEVIGKGAFAGCVGLEEVIGGKGVKEIRSNAFDRCENLHKIPDLLNGVEECGIYAFRGCKNLEVTERRHLTEEVIFQTCSYYTKR